MKTCPECGNDVRARVKGKCPTCKTELVLIKGKYLSAESIAPVEILTRILEKQVKRVQDNIFPYRIPQHMLYRTRQVLERAWSDYYPTMSDRGISSDEAIALIELAVEELINSLARDKVELGLLLWFISGKDDNKFQRILTKYIRSKERLVALSAEPDDWMD